MTMTKKKESPSTLARNARRKEDFLAKKRSATSDEKEKAVVGDPTATKETAAVDDPTAIPVDRDVD